MMRIALWLLGATLLLAACQKPSQPSVVAHRGVYHWKTTYNPSEWEKQWMKDHHVDRLYVKLFDVVDGAADNKPGWKMVPVATTQFLQPLPTDIDVVPVVYITVDAIRTLDRYDWSSLDYYAKLIVKRIDDIMAENLGSSASLSDSSSLLREVQLDCDWTRQTEATYFAFVRHIKEILHDRGITLSGTLRLHQLHEVESPTQNYFGTPDSIPFDRSLLMCYNTGRLQDPSTKNSILDFNDAKPYLQQYHLDSLSRTDVAYPVYGWGVAFDGKGRFQSLVSSRQLAGAQRPQGCTIREEWGSPAEIRRMQQALPVLDSNRTIVLYHLDSLNLTKYSHEDIEEFYSR